MIKQDALAQITQLLTTINCEKATFSTKQEAYFAKLDMPTVDRPIEIGEIMRTFGALYPIELLIKLEAYMSDLEQKQLGSAAFTLLPWDTENPPQWSHQRLMQRQHRRQHRATRKVKNTYQ